MANVLGQALVQLSGVGDWLLARRLRAMAEAGTVRVDEAGSTRGFYGAAVCLARTAGPGDGSAVPGPIYGYAFQYISPASRGRPRAAKSSSTVQNR